MRVQLTGLGALPDSFLDEASHKRIFFAGPTNSGMRCSSNPSLALVIWLATEGIHPDDNPSGWLANRLDDFTLLRLAGTHFHDHSNTFSLLPYGRKHWLLIPPSGSYDSPQSHSAVGAGVESADAGRAKLTPSEWLSWHEAHPGALPIEPLQCIQPAGTALFVPSGWKHAIINLAPSVGVAVEVGDTDVIERAQRGG